MSDSKRETLIDLAEDFDTAMLVTRTKSGDFRSRPMALAKVEEDGTFYFATDDDSEKAEEIRAEGEVNLSFQGDRKFLSVSGRATLLDDRELIDELWSSAWKIWFPEGKDDPRITIVRVEGRRGEYWDLSGARGLGYLWEAGKALVRGERLDMEDRSVHAKAELTHV